MKFAEFFVAVHGYPPFPWQEEVSRRLAVGKPLDFVRVPTAAGKSALVDIAIHAALHGGRRRICFVVDRRIVVDEVHQRTRHIMRALGNEPQLAELRATAGEMQVVRLRGGVHGDDDWVLYPERLTVLISTIDQVGSRLLFRGYGVSARMAPMHAGFLGNDLLLIVDEAHLAQPFTETVEALICYRADIRLIVMSATPHKAPQAPIDLTPDDRAHPVLSRRLRASKRAELIVAGSGDRAFAAALLAEAIKLSADSRVVGIVVNRVATARLVFSLLSTMGHAAVLLTGRCRPHDRDALLAEWLPQICVNRQRVAQTPCFVVATQTIEVGANLDFDALITESAPLSSLRQRFGRLDRMGERGTSRAAIVHRPPRGTDSVYGDALAATWNWLLEVAVGGIVDFGVDAIDEQTSRLPPPAEIPRHAPRLLPAHLRLLPQTGTLAPEIYIAPFLHGTARPGNEISVVWRADLGLEDTDRWAETIACRPPLDAEMLELPLATLRRWLAGESDGEVTDLLTHGSGEAVADRRPVIRWRGTEQADVVLPSALRPGDTVVLPAGYGGCDRYGWNPESANTVSDLADICSATRIKEHIVRLIEPTMTWAGTRTGELQRLAGRYLSLLHAAENTFDDTEIDEGAPNEAEHELRACLARIESPVIAALGNNYLLEPYPAGLLLRRNRLEDIAGSLTGGRAIALDAHLAGVADWCCKLAPEHPQAAQLERAARMHDQGKRDQRFQLMLHGDPLRAVLGPPLAKSGLRGRHALADAWRASGLPRGFRHELAALANAAAYTPLERHLIGTHHGYGRPWFATCADPQASGIAPAKLGQGWADQFTALNRSMGPWQLAGLEALLRAADARCSMEEQDDA